MSGPTVAGTPLLDGIAAATRNGAAPRAVFAAPATGDAAPDGPSSVRAAIGRIRDVIAQVLGPGAR